MPRPHCPVRRAGTALLGLLLAGCAGLPGAPAAVTTPSLAADALSDWDRADRPPAPPAAADDEALAGWWQQFDDPGLDRLMRDALAANRDLQVAQASLRQAQAARAAAEAARWPVLGLTGSGSRSATPDGAGNLYRLSFGASWEPDLDGSQAAGLAAADSDLAAARADLGITRMALAAELGLAYVQWRGAQARERITRESLSSLEQTLELAHWKARAGLASALDVEQSRLATEQTRASLSGVAVEVAQYAHVLAQLTARTPGQWRRDPLASTAADVPQAGAALQRLALGVPADLLRRRPDLRAAEAAVQAAWARQEQARRAAWPGLSLSGSLGWQAATLGALGSSGAGVAALAAAVDWTLFDAGLRRAQVDQQAALLERSRAAYDAAVLAAVKDVEDALVALRGSRERAEALQRADEAAAAALLATRWQHQTGLTDFATLLEAQRNELGTRLALQATRTDLSLNLIRLYKALGGGWQPEAMATAGG